MSTLHCPVVVVGKFAKNPNSEKLNVWNGPQGPIQFIDGTFNEGDRAVFIPKDCLVPIADPRFAFLSGNEDSRYPGYARIKAIKLRFIPSVGLLVKYTGDLETGLDASQELGVKKWEPPQTHSFNMGERNAESDDHEAAHIAPYDVENTWVFDNATAIGDSDTCDAMDYRCVWDITEKIHGCNMRFYVDANGVTHVGSRNVWLKEGPNPWWTAYNSRREFLEPLAKANPGIVFYGEVYGNVQDLKYGITGVDVRLFDAYSLIQGKFLPMSKLLDILLFKSGRKSNTEGLWFTSEFLAVPSLGTFTGSLAECIAHVREYGLHVGESRLCSSQIKEGVVIRPYHDTVLVNSKKGYHRLITKVVSPDYLSRNGGTEHQ